MTVQSETDSEWKVRGDVGILTKLVTMQVHVDEWVELSHVTFSVVCVEEPLTGKGLADRDGSLRGPFGARRSISTPPPAGCWVRS